METEKNKDKVKGNDKSDIHQDEIGENTGDDTQLAKEAKASDEKIGKESSNKGQGPSGENL